MDLQLQTIQLKQYLADLKKIYEENNPPEDRKDKQFFQKVKESTDPIYKLLASWEEDALQVIQQQKINVHPHQIISTKENMELILMHSFFIDVKRKRYMELHNSIIYILDQLLRNLS